MKSFTKKFPLPNLRKEKNLTKFHRRMDDRPEKEKSRKRWATTRPIDFS